MCDKRGSQRRGECVIVPAQASSAFCRSFPHPFMPCPIQRASQLSGLTAHVIRIWERRYSALSPSRTCTNRRMYCDEAI
ncbi:MAG: MerR family transcriptional regulator, partial [Prosthecobacter sp.]